MNHRQKTKKVKKSSRRLSRRKKNHKTNKIHKNWQTKQIGKEKLKIKTERARRAQTQKLPLNQTPPNNLNASTPS
jgi:hypothetical protein